MAPPVPHTPSDTMTPAPRPTSPTGLALRLVLGLLSGLLFACLTGTTARAQTAPTEPPADAADRPEPAQGTDPKTAWHRAVVDLSEQHLTVYDRDGAIVVRWGVSSGAPKTPTPTGRYRVTSKSRHTFAVKNPRVTMEHMVRFSGRIGFHSIPRIDGRPLPTPLGERGVSHGCIRLRDEHARELYRKLPIGALVVVRP